MAHWQMRADERETSEVVMITRSQKKRIHIHNYIGEIPFLEQLKTR